MGSSPASHARVAARYSRASKPEAARDQHGQPDRGDRPRTTPPASSAGTSARRIRDRGCAARAPGTRLEAARSDQRHEDAVAVGTVDPFVAVALDHGQHLAIAWPDRDHESTPIGQLLAKRLRNAGRGRGHDDPRPRGPGRVTQTPVGLPDLDGAGQPAGELGERRDPSREPARSAPHGVPATSPGRRATPGSRPGTRIRCRSRGSDRPAGSRGARSSARPSAAG